MWREKVADRRETAAIVEPVDDDRDTGQQAVHLARPGENVEVAGHPDNGPARVMLMFTSCWTGILIVRGARRVPPTAGCRGAGGRATVPSDVAAGQHPGVFGGRVLHAGPGFLLRDRGGPLRRRAVAPPEPDRPLGAEHTTAEHLQTATLHAIPPRTRRWEELARVGARRRIAVLELRYSPSRRAWLDLEALIGAEPVQCLFPPGPALRPWVAGERIEASTDRPDDLAFLAAMVHAEPGEQVVEH
jgi:hypothetical protein